MSCFSADRNLGSWIDECVDTISWVEWGIFGIQDSMVADFDYDDDLSKATRIGTITGCHIAQSLVVNIGCNPYTVCDDESSELEGMYSALMEFADSDDPIDMLNDIFYIREVELDKGYQGYGYEEIVLLQLPSIVVSALHVFPEILVFFPEPVDTMRQMRLCRLPQARELRQLV